MKKFVLMSAMMMMVLTMSAQQKFGHLNAQDVLTSMPEFSIANGEIEAKQKEFQNEFQEMQNEAEKAFSDYQKNKATMTADQQKAKEQELTDMSQKLQQASQDYQQQLQKLQQEKQQPLYTKLMNAITAVGKAGGYVYIMDSAGGALFINDAISEDVTAKVKAQLKAANTAATPAKATTKK